MRLFFSLLFLLSFGILHAQQPKQRALERPERNKGKGVLVHIGYGAGVPAADLAKRFGAHQSINLGTDFILENNIVFGIDGTLLFGQTVKEDPLSILKTPEGTIIGNDQTSSDYRLRQRATNLSVRAGYLFGLKHQRSGLLVTVGMGMFRHKIRIQDDTQNINQISGEYIKGYDRLSGGIAFTQFIGYQHLVRKSGLNWFAGFEGYQSTTKPLRLYDFSSMQYNTGTRRDLVFGFKAGITMPFIFEKTPEEIYY